jgi:hypothetical protein
MGRRPRGSRTRAAALGRSAALERELAELERELTAIEDSAEGRLPDVARPPVQEDLRGPRRGIGRDPVQGLVAAQARLARLHARVRALKRNPDLAPPVPGRQRRGGRFRGAGGADAPSEQPAGARLVAGKLAEAGAGRDEVDKYLHEIFSLDDRSS